MIDHTLSVTSPYTAGAMVSHAQKVLNGNNVFNRDFLQGAVDGVFGEETGRACIRAKYWLGYPTAALDPTYGEKVDGYLHGLEQPTRDMMVRRELREKAVADTPLAVKALRQAQAQIGVKEKPAGSNKVLFSDWYGIRGPWCAMFVTWCYDRSGSKAFTRGSRYAYVPYIVNDARAGRNGLSVTRAPLPGDVVCYDWDGGVADHTGLFEKGSRDMFHAIEGNTSVGNDSNGGEVMRRSRQGSQVECFVRVGR